MLKLSQFLNHCIRRPRPNNSKKTIGLLLILLYSVGSDAFSQDLSEIRNSLPETENIDIFLNTVWRSLKNPAGIAVAVYSPQGVYVRTLGVTDSTTMEKATSDTAFYIASNTKAYTALAMNVLHHKGKIDLNQSIKSFSPDAPFPDNVTPEKVKLRDLLSHTSGIENKPIITRLAFTGEYAPALLWNLLGASQINTKAPLGNFEYTNGGYNILTILTDKKLGIKWQDLLDNEIFHPLGMQHTTAYVSKAVNEHWSIARPHATEDVSGAKRIVFEKTDSLMQSAGGLITSANDALTWLELFVNDGRVGGKQIFSPDIIRETREPLIATGSKGGSFSRDHYGLGWIIGSYKEELVVHHSGGYAGFRSFTSYMPEQKIGVSVFVNDSLGSLFCEGIASYIYDDLLNKPDVLESAEAGKALYKKFENILVLIAKDKENRAKREWTLSKTNSDYEGVYMGDTGTIYVTSGNNLLHVRLGPLETIAEPFTMQDAIRVEFVPGQGEIIKFEIDEQGKVSSLLYDKLKFERTW